ncbi:MAG: hypothetical protein HZB67_03140, partial [Candidatus Aenigmarchaeota archaeon]|nr:hypothetical protein [Candidatus Aenigmarchaeota archaeon]
KGEISREEYAEERDKLLADAESEKADALISYIHHMGEVYGLALRYYSGEISLEEYGSITKDILRRYETEAKKEAPCSVAQ